MSALDKFLKVNRSKLSALKKKRREYKTSNFDKEIKQLEGLLSRFMKSKMDPRKVGHLVINYKVFDRFIKNLNLNKMPFIVTAKESSLRVDYGRVHGDWNGHLELNDLSEYFEGYGEIREADIEHE